MNKEEIFSEKDYYDGINVGMDIAEDLANTSLCSQLEYMKNGSKTIDYLLAIEEMEKWRLDNLKSL